MKAKKGIKADICSEERSLISSDYARNWICDFILGKYQAEYLDHYYLIVQIYSKDF